MDAFGTYRPIVDPPSCYFSSFRVMQVYLTMSAKPKLFSNLNGMHGRVRPYDAIMNAYGSQRTETPISRIRTLQIVLRACNPFLQPRGTPSFFG
jgi:hypothetical protein